MVIGTRPPEPQRQPPDRSWPHHELWLRVQDALRALPNYFKSETNIEGMLATDIFTLNSPLGATIEEQVVATLNLMRPVWDPGRNYQAHAFIRQSQTFPDVLLQKRMNGEEIIMGVELKGWYLLGKEGVPTFRFATTKAACAAPDLLVVVPWTLSNVLAGTPVIHPPFIELASFAAEKRNYYWQYERRARGDTRITVPQKINPYPTKGDHISDKPASDAGGNFGRIARYGIMTSYVQEAMSIKVRGITARDWLTFFQRHEEPVTD